MKRLLWLCVAFWMAIASSSAAETINVPRDFATIQAAVNAAAKGDTISVAAGIYFENLTVSKSVSIEGAGKEATTIDGSAGRARQLPTVLIKSTQGVTIKGFTIQGGRRGIQVEQATGVMIENNKVQRNARQGILITAGAQAEIRHNEVLENLPDAGGFVVRSIQIFGVGSQATLISNTIAGNPGTGLTVSLGGQAKLENNRITGNTYAAVLAIGDALVQLNGDLLQATRPGTDAPGASASPGYGLWIEDSSYGVLEEVSVQKNAGDGILVDRASLDVTQTHVRDNGGCGLRLAPGVEPFLGAGTILEANLAGGVCGALPSLDVGGRRTVTFNVSAAGEIKALASSPKGGTLALRLFAPNQTTPVAELSGPAPLQLVAPVAGGTAGRWRVELENTSPEALPVMLNVRQPLFTGTCEGILRDFFIAVVKEPDIRDVSAEECQMLYSVLKSLPLSIRGKVAQILRRSQDPEAAGRAQSAFIQLYGDQTRSFFIRVVFHEVAHVAHFKLFSPQQLSEWSQLHRASGSDPENYIGTVLPDGMPYGRTNEFEDFATVMEEYTADTIAALAIARERAARGKPVLLDKFRFLVQLFKDELGGPGVYIYRSVVRPMPDGTLRGVVQRAIVPLDGEGLPAIPAEPEWEDF
jgi:parallel beta-helix repeat protein